LNNDILGELEKLVQESASKRQSFLIAITKSSWAISDGASKWYCSEVELLQKEMNILKNVMPEEVSDWNLQLERISHRFQRALSYLNKIVEQAEKGKITSLGEVNPPKPEIETLQPIELFKKKEEEKELNLVSAILEVFDSATDLEKLIKDVEKESKRTIYIIKVIQKR
jgi:phenylpropionate dioxygenase-like ring-hydroxylating dioxygenase large terminal subunit